MANRDQETRDATKRKQSWAPPSLLPDPDAQKGWRYRWVRAASAGSADNRNVSKRLREGWEPVAMSEHPELKTNSDRKSEFEGGVEIGGLLLCKTPEENVIARNEHYNNIAQNQMKSVDNTFFREQDPRMPTLQKERRTRTSFGNGGE